MRALYLYLYVWTVFLIVLIIFFLIKFSIKFIKLNGVKAIFLEFLKKEYRLLELTIIIFTLSFWLSYFLIYSNRRYPDIYVGMSIKDKNLSYGEIIRIDDYKNNNIKNMFNEKYLTVIAYNKKYVKFKLNTTMIVNECLDCSDIILNANQEYKLNKNEEVYFKTIDKKISYMVEFKEG